VSMENIHIYHTNDLHSHLKRWPRIQQFLSDRRSFHTDANGEFFLFDIGDFVDRWHPLSEATKGQGNIELLNNCNYTAVAIGNNEGINFSFEDLDHLYDYADFDVLTANLYDKNHKHPDWLEPYKIYQTKNGTRLGVIGVTANFPLLYNLLGWELTEPIAELQKWLPILQEKSDVIIVLSHLGLHHDEQIATLFPEVDVILGGHTHHTLPEGKQMGTTMIAGAGKHGKFVGHVTIGVDDQKDIKSSIAKVYNVMELPVVTDEKMIAKELFRKGKKLLNQKITSLNQPLIHDPFQETELSKLLCSAVREWCAADCAFINAGLLLGSLSGNVTAYDLLIICPHPINPCRIELTGRELKEVLLETKDVDWPHREIRGLGFRGTVIGASIYDGIIFKEDNTIFVNGMELDIDKKYTLAIPDMFTFGHFFKGIFPNKDKKYFLPEFLRDILRLKLQNRS
jgi:5'-nucleotidase